MLHMRKTATFRTHVLAVSCAITTDDLHREVVEELSHEPAASSESARLDQLAFIGALAVERAVKERAYAELAKVFVDEPDLSVIQTTMGAPIEGETDADLEALFESLSSQ